MSSKGFTLLEIVAALAILGISIAVMMQIFSGGLKNIHRIDMAHRAMHHAENVMNQILSNQEIRDPVTLSDELDDEFSYTAELNYWEEPQQNLSIDAASSPMHLLRVRVDVHFKNDTHGKVYRTICLKAVSDEEAMAGGTSADVIRQLFGNRQQRNQ